MGLRIIRKVQSENVLTVVLIQLPLEPNSIIHAHVQETASGRVLFMLVLIKTTPEGISRAVKQRFQTISCALGLIPSTAR